MQLMQRILLWMCTTAKSMESADGISTVASSIVDEAKAGAIEGAANVQNSMHAAAQEIHAEGKRLQTLQRLQHGGNRCSPVHIS